MITLLLLSLYSCDENSLHPCERGNGSLVSEVRVSDELDVTIRSSGNVRYKGKPLVSTTITGSGALINDS